MNKIAITLLSALLIAPVNAFAKSVVSDAPENAEVYFVQPSDGATVEGTIKVVFGLRNMGVAPAGAPSLPSARALSSLAYATAAFTAVGYVPR